MKQTGNYDVVYHCYIGDSPVNESKGICMRVGCKNIADCPWPYPDKNGNQFNVCWTCDDYWYHMGSRSHKNCQCPEDCKVGQCHESFMEFKNREKEK